MNSGSSQPHQGNSECTGTAQLSMMPDRPVAADVATAFKQPNSGCDRPDCHEYLRMLPFVGSNHAREPTTVKSVHTHSNAEQSRTVQVAQGDPQKSTPKVQPGISEKKKTKEEAMAGSWRKMGDKATQKGPTDSTRKGG
jgi:hypothetical protein